MVRNWDPAIGELYRGLGLITVTLAETDQRLSSERAQELRAALTSSE